jgi:hypothetical protein
MILLSPILASPTVGATELDLLRQAHASARDANKSRNLLYRAVPRGTEVAALHEELSNTPILPADWQIVIDLVASAQEKIARHHGNVPRRLWAQPALRALEAQLKAFDVRPSPLRPALEAWNHRLLAWSQAAPAP